MVAIKDSRIAVRLSSRQDALRDGLRIVYDCDGHLALAASASAG